MRCGTGFGLIAVLFCCSGLSWAAEVSVDPLTRLIHVRYAVPAGAPPMVTVECTWSPPGANAFRPANVVPYISETALGLAPQAERTRWTTQGLLTERRAAGLTRTVIFNPYPDAIDAGAVQADFRIRVLGDDGEALAVEECRIALPQTDVVYIEQWDQVFQRERVSTEGGDGGWQWRTGLDAAAAAAGGDLLSCAAAGQGMPPAQLTYPLDLRGWYAVHVVTAPAEGGARLRFTGDERADSFGSRFPREEVFWRVAKLDRQHLVIAPPHDYTGYTAASIDYVKLVPISEAQAAGQLPPRAADKFVAAYWEPYSWAFVENIQSPLQHREPLIPYAEAGISLVDTQIGRFGDKVVYESRLTDPLLYATIGDPIGDIAVPKTDNVGRMQQYTNTLETELRHARDLGLLVSANFGASACYRGTPLEADISKQHPEWVRGDQLRYEVPEVRDYVLRLYREALEIGAPAISIDFCRYPATIDVPETCNAFLRELRALAGEFATARGAAVPILVRFPGIGVRQWQDFDYATWAREGLVDYLCPSNLQGRHMHLDIAPYVAAVRGTSVQLLPSVDGLSWGYAFPGQFLWRVQQLYAQGVPGIHVYQADARLLGWPGDRRMMGLLRSSEAVAAWWAAEQAATPARSKGLYITAPHEFGKYNGWERLRVWPEGVAWGAMAFYLDGALVYECAGPPYQLGSEESSDDGIIPSGEHELLIRMPDGDGWIEQRFAIRGG